MNSPGMTSPKHFSLEDVNTISDDMSVQLESQNLSKGDFSNFSEGKVNESNTISENTIRYPASDRAFTPYNSRKTNVSRSISENEKEISDDSKRKELLWTSRIENVIKGWYEHCLQCATVHGSRSKYHKKIFYGLGIPTAILPLVLIAINDNTAEEPIVTAVFLIAISILSTVNGFLNPGKRSESHLNFEAQYNELAVEITSELVKPRCHRQDADVFIQRIMDRYNNLNGRAPPT